MHEQGARQGAYKYDTHDVIFRTGTTRVSSLQNYRYPTPRHLVSLTISAYRSARGEPTGTYDETLDAHVFGCVVVK
jgi:hypothetical protein